MEARIGATGLFAFEFRLVTNLATSLAVLVVIAIIARGLLALVILAHLATSLAVLVVVAPIAPRLFALVVDTLFVTVSALAILAAKGGTVGGAFAAEAVFVAWLTL